MLGLGRNGLRKIASGRALSTAAPQSIASTPTPSPPQQPKESEDGRSDRKNFTKPANRSFVTSTTAEQMKLQKKYQEKLENNTLSTLHDAVEYVEWRGTVYPQTLSKIISLLEQSSDLSSLSDRQIAVLLSAFGANCDTLSRSIRAQHLEKVETVLREKGVVLGLVGRNKLIEVKIDNRSKVDAVEELGKFEESGIELDGNSYALLCEVYAKQANTKAITDIIGHMKSSGIPLMEDHVAQLVYSVARGGNYSQVGRIVDTFSTSMNVVRLRCAAARAIAEREKSENGRGGFEVTEMLRGIPTTAKLHAFDNNVYVLNVLMDLIENGQLDAFNLLSSYLIVSESGKTLADNKLNLKVIAKAKSLLSERSIEEAITSYSCVHPNYSNDYFLQKLQYQLENELKTVTSSTLQNYLKTLTLAENKGLLPNANEFLLSTCAKMVIPAFAAVFEHVFVSGDLRSILEKNPSLKRPIGRQLSHQLLKTVSPSEKAGILAKIATVIFAPSPSESVHGAYGFYQIIYNVANKVQRGFHFGLQIISFHV
uniref:Uncharacterized protein n=1 Tax=Caenorhabditis japonica TaxID=281687 RepID=A0A8R1I7C9_CAEJA